MFRLLTILSFSFLFCIDAKAQNKTLPDALFSTDGKYALIKSKMVSYCKSEVEIWYLFFSDSDKNFYGSDKEQPVYAKNNDSIYMLSFEEKNESQPYYISDDGCKTYAHIINSYQLSEFLNRYSFFIQPKNCTKDLVVIFDTIKSEPQKNLWTSGDSTIKINRTIGASFYFKNHFLLRDSVQTNFSNSEIKDNLTKIDSPAHKVNYLVLFSSDNDWFDDNYMNQDRYTTIYYDSVSNYFWLYSSIYAPMFEVITNYENIAGDHLPIIIRKGENFQSKIKLSKLN